MYARQIEDRTLTFAVSGKLWENSLVMVDQETESLWSHIMGAAMEGPLQGAELEVIPSIMTDWKSWYERHPATTVAVMRRTSGDYVRSFYGQAGIDLGYADGDESRSWPLDNLVNAPVVNDTINEQPVVVMYDRDSKTAAMYHRLLNDQLLTFESREQNIVDTQTESTWDVITGRATSGPLEGSKLVRLPAMLTESSAWGTYHATTAKPKDQ